MAMVRGSFMDMSEVIRKLSKARTQVQDMKMGQMDAYKTMQAAMQGQHSQYMDNTLLAQNQLVMNNLLVGNGIGRVGIANIPNNPNYNQEPIYPGKTIYPDSYRQGRLPIWQKWAEHFGFKEDFNTGGFKHPNGGFVSKKWLEDIEGTSTSYEKVFKRALTPNIYWLEDRVNEVRVKLC